MTQFKEELCATKDADLLLVNPIAKKYLIDQNKKVINPNSYE